MNERTAEPDRWGDSIVLSPRHHDRLVISDDDGPVVTLAFEPGRWPGTMRVKVGPHWRKAAGSADGGMGWLSRWGRRPASRRRPGEIG